MSTSKSWLRAAVATSNDDSTAHGSADRRTGVQPRSCQPDAQTARRVLGAGIIDLAQHAMYV